MKKITRVIVALFAAAALAAVAGPADADAGGNAAPMNHWCC